MDNFFKFIKFTVTALGGILSFVFGGFDKLLIMLLMLMVLDYVSGIVKAVYNKSLNSGIGFKGLLKKVMILLVVVLVSILQKNLSGDIPLRDVVLMFYASNEGISIIENLGAVIPIPERLKEYFEQLKKGV